MLYCFAAPFLFRSSPTLLRMIFFILLGIVLGIISVVFVSQNTDVVMVSFLSWQFDGSLALILFLTFISGVIMTLLVLTPSLIKGSFQLASTRRKKKALEAELEATKQAHHEEHIRNETVESAAMSPVDTNLR